MNKWIKNIILVVVIILALGLFKNGLVKGMLTGTMSNVAHVPVKIGSVNLSFLSASIRLKDLEVFNPSGFPEKKMVVIPQIFIDFEPGALFQGRAHFREVRLDLKQMIVVKDKNGRLNVDAVKPTEQQKKEAKQKAQAPAEGKNKGQAPKLMIDKLYLSIGQVVYKDYSKGGQPEVQTFDINIKDREFSNIDNPAAVVSLVMFEALAKTTLSRLANLDLNAFKEGGLKGLSEGLGLVTDGTDAVQNKAKQLLNFLK